MKMRVKSKSEIEKTLDRKECPLDCDRTDGLLLPEEVIQKCGSIVDVRFAYGDRYYDNDDDYLIYSKDWLGPVEEEPKENICNACDLKACEDSNSPMTCKKKKRRELVTNALTIYANYMEKIFVHVLIF